MHVICLHKTNKYCLFQLTYILGSVLVIGACIWMFFLSSNTELEIIGAAILLGMGNSTILVTSLSILADLIGENTVSYDYCLDIRV